MIQILEKWYVANSRSNTVSVIDDTTDKVKNVIPVGKYPVGIAIDPNTKKVYVTNRNSDTVSVIDEKNISVLIQMLFLKDSIQQSWD